MAVTNALAGTPEPYPPPRNDQLENLFRPFPPKAYLVPPSVGNFTADVSDAGYSTSIGARASPGPTIDQSGPIWAFTFLTGVGATVAGKSVKNADPLTLNASTGGNVMIGGQTSIGQHYLAAMIGAETEFVHDPNTTRKILRRYGPRLEASFWSNLTDKMIATGNFTAGGAHGSLWGRFRLGYDIFGLAYIGPETSLYADRTDYDQLRVGLHLTGPRLWTYSAEISGGLMLDSDKRRGAYGALAVINRF